MPSSLRGLGFQVEWMETVADASTEGRGRDTLVEVDKRWLKKETRKYISKAIV